MGVNIKFDSWNGKGKVIPQFDAVKKIDKVPNQLNENAAASREKIDQKIEQELQRKILHMEAFFETLDTDLIFDADLLSDKHFKEGGIKLKAITDKWDNALERYEDNKEKTEALSKDLDECDQMLRNFLAEIDEWKKEARDRIEFLEKNKGWNDQFVKAGKNIEEFSGTKEEFEKKYAEHGSKKAAEEDFNYDVRPILLDWATKSDQQIKEFDVKEWNQWKKLLGAAKMVNSNLPKTVVVFNGESFGVDTVKVKKVNDKEQIRIARESLNGIVSEKLHEKFSSKGINDLAGNPFKLKSANLRYLSFVVAREIIEKEDNLHLVIKEGLDSPSLDAEKKKIDNLIEDIFSDNKKANELVLRVYIYNVVGQTLATDKKFEKLTSEEKNLKQRELVEDGLFDDVMKEFSDELNNFFELRGESGSEGVPFAKEERIKLNTAIKRLVEEAMNAADKIDSDASVTNTEAVVASEEESKKKEDTPDENADTGKANKKTETGKEKAEEKEKTEKELYEEAGPNVTIVLEKGLKDQYELYLDATRNGEFTLQEADKYLQEDISEILKALSLKNTDKMTSYVFSLIKNSVK